jgi:AAA15 family ATPase/GTPase
MDINIEDLHYEEESIDSSFFTKAFSKEFLKEIRSAGAPPFPEKRNIVKFVKRRSDGSKTMLPIGEESTGTRALYNLAGPLHDALEKGYCLLIDEINTSLHPVVVHFLIKMFNSKKTNPKRAQLICTSHDVSVLRDEFVRRDQVWFIENDGCGAQLVPLSDYSPRRNEALERGYLRGRYGGIPTIDSYLLKFISSE